MSRRKKEEISVEQLIEPTNEGEITWSEDDIALANLELMSEKQLVTRRQIIYAKNILADAVELMLNKYKGYKRTYTQKESDGLTLLPILTDDHFGKKIYDFNSNTAKVIYDLDVAKKRLDAYFDKQTEMIMSNKRYDEAILNFLGDHTEGDGNIFPGQALEIITGGANQTHAFVDALWPRITELASMLEKRKGKLKMMWVPGNHGEQRGRYSTNHQDNWDILAARLLEFAIYKLQERGQLKNIELHYPDINFPKRNFLRYKVRGWIYHLEHVLPMNLISPSGMNKVKSLTETFSTPTDVVITGHFHSECICTVNRTTVIRVPSLPGYDSFAGDIKATPSEAMHSIITVSNEQKIDSYVPYVLEAIR